MSSALPEPEPKFTAGLRVSKPGEEPEAWRPYPQPGPIEPDGVGAGFAIGWLVFRLVVWGLIAVWIHPRLLDHVGGHGVARWLEHHGWLRILAVPPLGLLGLISAFQVINTPRQRAAREALAAGVGATLVEPPGMDPTYGISDGPGLRVPLGRWSMDVARWRDNAIAHTIARVNVETGSEFSFVARGAGREPALLRTLQQGAIGFALRQAANREGDPRAAAVATTLAYMAGPPISIGSDALDGSVVLRSNQPDVARALFARSAVSSAIVALDAKTNHWDWTFYPGRTVGAAEMQFDCPGALDDAESLRLVQTLLRAALEHLASTGAIAG